MIEMKVADLMLVAKVLQMEAHQKAVPARKREKVCSFVSQKPARVDWSVVFVIETQDNTTNPVVRISGQDLMV